MATESGLDGRRAEIFCRWGNVKEVGERFGGSRLEGRTSVGAVLTEDTSRTGLGGAAISKENEGEEESTEKLI